MSWSTECPGRIQSKSESIDPSISRSTVRKDVEPTRPLSSPPSGSCRFFLCLRKAAAPAAAAAAPAPPAATAVVVSGAGNPPPYPSLALTPFKMPQIASTKLAQAAFRTALTSRYRCRLLCNLHIFCKSYPPACGASSTLALPIECQESCACPPEIDELGE